PLSISYASFIRAALLSVRGRPPHERATDYSRHQGAHRQGRPCLRESRAALHRHRPAPQGTQGPAWRLLKRREKQQAQLWRDGGNMIEARRDASPGLNLTAGYPPEYLPYRATYARYLYPNKKQDGMA